MTARVRLTTKTATEGDAYNLNDARPKEESRGGNGSGETFQKEYAIGDAKSFGEEPISTAETKKLHDKDVNDRNEVGMGNIRMAFQQSIKNARELDDRAAKCLTAAERILPGAKAASIEAQAMDLMFLPSAAIDSLLSRQASLAQDIVATAETVAGTLPPALQAAIDAKKEEKKAGDDEAAEGDKAPKGDDEAAEGEKPVITPEKEEKEDVVTAMKAQMDAMAATIKGLQDQIGATASVGQNAPFASNATDPTAAPAVDPTAAPAPAPMAAQASTKTASSHDDADVLDSIFAAVEPAGKRGASQLSGMVRKASEVSEADLSSIWGSTPDVSSVFN